MPQWTSEVLKFQDHNLAWFLLKDPALWALSGVSCNYNSCNFSYRKEVPFCLPGSLSEFGQLGKMDHSPGRKQPIKIIWSFNSNCKFTVEMGSKTVYNLKEKKNAASILQLMWYLCVCVCMTNFLSIASNTTCTWRSHRGPAEEIINVRKLEGKTWFCRCVWLGESCFFLFSPWTPVSSWPWDSAGMTASSDKGRNVFCKLNLHSWVTLLNSPSYLSDSWRSDSRLTLLVLRIPTV